MQLGTDTATQRLIKSTAEATCNLMQKKKGQTATAQAETTDTAASSTTTTSTTSATTTKTGTTREPIERLESNILEYLYKPTQHVKKMAERKIQLAKAQMDEYKALEDFEQVATASHWNLDSILKPKIKLWSTKNKNNYIVQKRIELDLPPRFISNINFTFKVDESIINQEEAQTLYNEMRRLTKSYQNETMILYQQAVLREKELLTHEIEHIIESLPHSDSDTQDEVSYAAFKNYHDLPSRGRSQRKRTTCCPGSYSITGRGILAPAIINQAQIRLTEEEHQILKLGPRFIYNDPTTASRRRTTELATLKRKIEARFFEKKVSPGRPVEQFIAELDVLLQNLHNTPAINKNSSIIINSQSTQSQINNSPIIKKKKNYGRLVKRLRHKFRLANVIIRKSDKSKVFHLGRTEDYQKKSEEYMAKTQAYQCLGTIDPLPDLIRRTNKYLLNLRLAKWITQKQYELLFIKPDEVELAHLYYLPKAHKPGTPLRPIVSGLKHPTVKISKFLDNLLRPIFDKMASKSTVTSGFELVKHLQEWSKINIRQETLFCTIDVTDLYTMVPQIEGVLSLKKMLDYLKMKQIGGLKTETIIRLSRFVMQNNYFSYNGQYYHQILGGAMGAPLTLTVANCYMFFYEQDIIKQIKNSGGLYFRYIG
ncbi:unnamed protein product, partial [Rotaria sp. Silwood2]